VNAIVQGILLGGLYAMFAAGLSLLFGVMRLVNLAHGDIAVLGAYLCLVVTETFNINPLVALAIVLPGAFVAGIVLERLVFDRLVGVDPTYAIVATFGLSIIIQNALLQHYGADQQRLDVGRLDSASIKLTNDISIGWLPLVTFFAGVVVLGLLSLFLHRTKTGVAFRATSDDAEAARLMGIDNRRIYMVATGLSVATAVLAGVFLGARTFFSPSAGPVRLIYAFEAVIIGGLGSLWGTLAGGIVLGVAQTVGFQWQPGWGQLMGDLVFLAVIAVRPNGLFGKASFA
jgi:branched-chain amino acid transport system permease protein